MIDLDLPLSHVHNRSANTNISYGARQRAVLDEPDCAAAMREIVLVAENSDEAR